MFFDAHGYYPGRDGRSLAMAADASEVYSFATRVAAKYGLEGMEQFGKYFGSADGEDGGQCLEVTRWFAGELHNIGSVLGGVASQEAVKIITGQYELGEGSTYVFNGINGTAGNYNF